MSYEENKRTIGRLLLALVFLATAVVLIIQADYPLYQKWLPNIEDIGKSLFLEFGIPFELVSLLVLAVIFGAIHIVRREEL
ncbi:MAG: NADH-quinone oxidoreductase subunit J [Archaeoglobaceae archaeon]